MAHRDTSDGRSHRERKTARLDDALAAEQLDEFGERVLRAPRKAPRKRKRPSASAASDDKDRDESTDNSFESSSDGTSAEESNSDIEILNEEVADLLPSKTIPEAVNAKKPSTRGANRKLSATRKKARTVTFEEVEDEDSPRNLSARSSPLPALSATTVGSSQPSAGPTKAPTAKDKRQDPIYLFYEAVSHDAYGKSEPGTKYYKSYHGNREIKAITKGMKGNINGLKNHLKKFPQMDGLYSILADPSRRHIPPTVEEVSMASGTLSDPEAKAKLVRALEASQESLKAAFDKQQAKAAGPWDQEKFERLVTEWVVACDQPFSAVEEPEYIAMMEYAHHPAPSLDIPKRKAVKQRTMKMGEDTVGGIRKMFDELEGKVSLSLDAWTSSNQHAFLAIVAHYITNDGELEELLIDFRELLGEHSGENMAEAVWETLELYGLVGRIISLVMDNASNNNTLAVGIENRCYENNIPFTAGDARMRCMPHTIHLAALKLLEGIGAISKAERRKAASRSGNYQEEINVPLERETDDDAVAQEDNHEDEYEDSDDEKEKGKGKGAGTSQKDKATESEEVLTAVGKLRTIVRVVRSSPQRRQTWAKEIAVMMNKEDDGKSPALMLILDVKTRWSSTHQMLRRALDYRPAIDSFVSRNKDLRLKYELSDADWQAITLVADWLKSFRAATTQMSATAKPMLSTTLAIFRGLQDELKSILRTLPSSVAPEIKKGLIDAHRKLSDYYYKFEESPFYTWSALLDPRISYEGLKYDYSDDIVLSDYLEVSKTRLHKYFNDNYAKKHTSQSQAAPTPQAASASMLSSPKKIFTARFQRQANIVEDELEEYFKLPQEPFETCDPVRWWFNHRSRFPNLFWLARDIISIPGSAVAVERVFSGGRDTISIRRASLTPETIRTLMLVKKKLHLKRERAKRALRRLYE